MSDRMPDGYPSGSGGFSNRTLLLMMGFVGVLILAVGTIFAIVALSGGDDDDNPPASGDNGDNPAATRTPGGGGANTSAICESKTLIVPGSEPLSPFDPIQVGDDATATYIVEIFGGLVTLDRDLEVQPDIAESWDTSEDDRVYTFHLRRDVVFHNNTRVTAEDFKYSFERAADPANASVTARAYLSNIVGVLDKLDGRADEVSGVRVIDESTLEIEVIEPTDYFLFELTYPVAFVVSQDQIEQDPRNWTRKPIGTGPFQVADYSLQERIRLVRNDRYHLGAPLLEEIQFQLAGGSLSAQYENDEIHVLDAFVAEELEAIATGNHPLSDEYQSVPLMSVSYLTLNTQQAPFDDPNIREAVALAIDRERINDVLNLGLGRVADGILPPEVPGYDEATTTYGYDLERARQLIEDSSYAGNMPRIILTYGGSGAASPAVLQAMQQTWAQIGLDVQLQAVDYAALIREQRRGTFQMLSEGWIADYPDPETFLGKLFGSESALNYTGYENDDVDALLDQATTSLDRDERYDLYQQAEQIIIDDAAMIPMFWGVEHLVVKPCVVDYPTQPMTVPAYRFTDIQP